MAQASHIQEHGASPHPLAGRMIAVDPGHNGRNWTHADVAISAG
jgi:N-acetylmuramoyl-L-alanine amidase